MPSAGLFEGFGANQAQCRTNLSAGRPHGFGATRQVSSIRVLGRTYRRRWMECLIRLCRLLALRPPEEPCDHSLTAPQQNLMKFLSAG